MIVSVDHRRSLVALSKILVWLLSRRSWFGCFRRQPTQSSDDVRFMSSRPLTLLRNVTLVVYMGRESGQCDVTLSHSHCYGKKPGNAI